MDKQSKQTSSPSFKDKLKMMFCAKPTIHSQPKIYKKQAQRKQTIIRKQTRQTLNIDDAFLKLSRKNIVQQQFFTNDILNLQLQKHISGRAKGISVALVKGQFTEQTTQSIKLPIYLNQKPIKTIPYRQQIKTDNLIKIRKNFIDLILYQTDQTYAGSVIKKNKLKNQNIVQNGTQININAQNKLIQQQKRDILNLIKIYSGLVDHMIIICSKYSQPLQYNKQLIQYTKQYMFELQRIRQNQDLICNIIYISKNATFLKLNDKAFKQFIISQMDMTLEQQGRMSHILSKLIQNKYHKEIAYTVRKLKKQTFGTRSLFQPFIIKISIQDQNIKKIIVEMKDIIFKQETVPYTPQLNQPTPLFHHQNRKISDNQII